MSQHPKQTSEYLSSFGRVKARPFSKLQKEALDNHLQKYLLTTENAIDALKKNNKPIILEIGYGTGTHLVHLAKNNPDSLIIGCEVYLNGVAQVVIEIIKNKFENILLFKDDCRELLKKLPASSLDKVFILFPDPWPKRKHKDRRIINEHTINLLEKTMKKNAVLRFASDDINYYKQASQILGKQSFFKEIFNSLPEYKIPEDHLKTKYQTIADKAGRVSNFYEVQKI